MQGDFRMIPIMLQRWHEISFLHWSCDAHHVQACLPAGLVPDLFDGKAWISMTPFLLKGLRPPLLPKWAGMDFPETNLRTYVIGAKGPGIWFFSLDAARVSAVVGARMTYGLPYYQARMQVGIGQFENTYASRRKTGIYTSIRIAKGAAIETQSSLDVFLTARFRLYSLWANRLTTAEVEHPPWPLRHAAVLQLEENLKLAMGVDFPHEDFVVHQSAGVDTRIGRPVLVS
jgi:uncharacterized protein